MLLRTRLSLYLVCLAVTSLTAQDGARTDTGYYASGKVHYITYRRNGEPFKDVFYYENGVRQAEHSFVNSMLNGSCHTWYPDGALATKYQCRNGQRYGLFESYYESGQLKQSGLYRDGLAEKTWRSFDSTGTLKAKREYARGKLEGPSQHYYSDGSLQHEYFYHKDLREGTGNSYYPGGTVKFRVSYHKGRMNGVRLYYNENGQPANGHFVSYHENSAKEREVECVNGKLEGLLSVYTETGRLSILASFKDGKPEGLASYYDESGNLKRTELYKNGKFIKEQAGGNEKPREE